MVTALSKCEIARGIARRTKPRPHRDRRLAEALSEQRVRIAAVGEDARDVEAGPGAGAENDLQPVERVVG